MDNISAPATIPAYPVRTSQGTRNRVCLALDLQSDPALIEAYKKYHTSDYWPEIAEGIRQAGIVCMDIFYVDDRLFMICELPAEKDFQTVWEAIAQYPRQAEWAQLMAAFQQALPRRAQGWVPMERIYSLENFQE